MLLKVIDALGNPQTIITPAQEAIVDHSGAITSTGQSQLGIDANPLRSGWGGQNIGTSPLWYNPLGGDATVGAGSYMVPVGGMFPPPGAPVTTNAINLLGTAASAYTLQEW